MGLLEIDPDLTRKTKHHEPPDFNHFPNDQQRQKNSASLNRNYHQNTFSELPTGGPAGGLRLRARGGPKSPGSSSAPKPRRG
eukprot:528767-Alexandrium_andersonii.AAC.1